MTYTEAIKELEVAINFNAISNPITDRAIEVLKRLVEGSACALSNIHGNAEQNICGGCLHHGEKICESCARMGHGNDVDFYAADAGKGE